ncbi:hypothetical protein HKX48_002976, partial [Thoreauomyces humboldtii]
YLNLLRDAKSGSGATDGTFVRAVDETAFLERWAAEDVRPSTLIRTTSSDYADLARSVEDGWVRVASSACRKVLEPYYYSRMWKILDLVATGAGSSPNIMLPTNPLSVHRHQVERSII